MIAPYPCPECAGVLDLTEAQTGQEWWRKADASGMPYTEIILRPCVVGACSECSFIIEVVP